MIKFIYNPNPEMMKLIIGNVADYSNSFLYGIMEEETKFQLKNMQLYLVCEINDSDGMRFYSNPLAVVAKSDYDAVGVYYKETEKPGSIMCVLENSVVGLKVETID